jgi:uncharacterized protein (DUF1501 family)
MQRRHFLATLAAAPLAGLSGRLFAAPTSLPRFLLVFLRGGYDCANLLVPYASDFYYESRPNIAIARPDSSAGGALRLDSDWALAPAVREALEPLYAKKQIAFVPFAGTPTTSNTACRKTTMPIAPDSSRACPARSMAWPRRLRSPPLCR